MAYSRYMNYTNEVWKIVPGLPHYAVSDHGRIKVVQGERKGIILNPNIGNNGYKRVNFWNNGNRKQFLVHRLILLAFVGPCPKGMEVAHFDGDKLNNNLSNLRYTTRSENNNQDKLRHGRLCRGETHGQSKLTESNVRDIRQLLASKRYKQREIAAMFGISQCTVADIGLKRRWGWLT